MRRNFMNFVPDFIPKIEAADVRYPAHEALLLAAGMMEKESKTWEEDNTHRNLLVIIGEEPASDPLYEKIKHWICERKQTPFDLLSL